MGKHKNTALVQAAYGAFLRGDIAAILDKLTDDVEWIVGSPANGVPWFGTYRGKEGVQKFFEAIGKEIDFTVFEPTEYVSQYDKIVALVHAEFTIKKNKRTVVQDEVMVWTVQDMKLTRFRAYEDTGAVIKAWESA